MDRDMGAACGSGYGVETEGDRAIREERRRLEQLEFDRSLARQLHAYADRINVAVGRHEHPFESSQVADLVARARSVADQMMRWTEAGADARYARSPRV